MEQLVFRGGPKHEQTEAHITRTQNKEGLKWLMNVSAAIWHELNLGEISSLMTISSSVLLILSCLTENVTCTGKIDRDHRRVLRHSVLHSLHRNGNIIKTFLASGVAECQCRTKEMANRNKSVVWHENLRRVNRDWDVFSGSARKSSLSPPKVPLDRWAQVVNLVCFSQICTDAQSQSPEQMLRSARTHSHTL